MEMAQKVLQQPLGSIDRLSPHHHTDEQNVLPGVEHKPNCPEGALPTLQAGG